MTSKFEKNKRNIEFLRINKVIKTRPRRRPRVWEYSCCIVVKTHKVFENITNEKLKKNPIKMKPSNNFQQADEANMKKSFSLFDLLYGDDLELIKLE